ncbi:nucleoside hydrolase [Alloacidobacterium sp.]|uniref:nucleoside hydrolase n=1 Tax=Alloacidobacterium sp. TaxID=2951999 RepID=UPI002D58463B|nr:nucleoside hydrolase [Alloacidobacterium sp.]HYK35557.1 nucleoside hydrolase [Alloacidobacterium sp.]
MSISRWLKVFAACFVVCIGAFAQQQKVIIDTDIGDDIDDAFAVSLVLSSPELKILGVTSAWGDTELRSRMLDRLLCEAGRSDIPVTTGVKTASKTTFSQEAWAKAGETHTHADAVDFLLGQIRKNPGEITLIAIAPLTNIGAAIDRDPVTFKKLKRVVMMGGSIRRGYDEFGVVGTAPRPADAEYNIAMAPEAAQKLIQSGVPIYMMPLDSTQLKFDEVKRGMLTTVSTPLTDSLQVLTAEWQRATHQATPTMFDVMAAAYAIKPELCPATPLHIDVDDEGFTREGPGTANVNVCLNSDSDQFFQFLMPRLLEQKLHGASSCVVK